MSEAARDLAVRSVADACRVARGVQKDLDRVRTVLKDDRSPVTVADFAVQAIVGLALRDADPDAPLVGEETAEALRADDGAATREAVVEAVRRVRPDVTEEEVLDAIDRGDHDGSAKRFWTLDPVDGTKGFLRGQQYAIALALVERGTPTVGVLGCPNLPVDHDAPLDKADGAGSMYVAVRGQGTVELAGCDADAEPRAVKAARRGPKNPLGTSPNIVGGGSGGGGGGVISLGETAPLRVCESVEKAHSNQSDSARVIAELGAEPQPVRLDSQCKYAVVARGQADAYLRLPTRPGYVEKIWDHAAGMLVATEAGATVSDVTGRPLDFSKGTRLEANRGVVCSITDAHEGIVKAIDTLGIGTPA